MTLAESLPLTHWWWPRQSWRNMSSSSRWGPLEMEDTNHLSECFHLMLSGCLPDGQHGIDRNVFHALHQHAQNSKFDWIMQLFNAEDCWVQWYLSFLFLFTCPNIIIQKNSVVKTSLLGSGIIIWIYKKVQTQWNLFDGT